MSYDLDPEGKFVLYSSNKPGIPQLFIISVQENSKPKQITNEKQTILSGAIAPSRDKLIYSMDKDGNELHHLFLLPIDGGEPKQVTNTPAKTLGTIWHPNGNLIVRSTISGMKFDLEVFNIKNGESYPFMKEIPVLVGGKYSHDGKWLATTTYESLERSKLIVFNTENPNESITYDMAGYPSWSLDDKKIAFTDNTTKRPLIGIQEFQEEERFVLELEEGEEVPPFDFATPAWSPKGDKIYFPIGKYGRGTIKCYNIEERRKELDLQLPLGVSLSPKITSDGKQLAFLHSSINSPRGVYFYNIDSGIVAPITPRDFDIDLSEIPPLQSIWYESSDGCRIHGYYLSATSRSKPNPGIIDVHGGPWGQTPDDWFYAFFLAPLSISGFSVFSPNFRGSTGYGKEFQDLDLGDPGGGDLEDVVYAAKWLKNQPDVDGSRIGIEGISYGGFMTLIALTKKPDVFKSGVSLVPITDWIYDFNCPHEEADLSNQMFLTKLFQGKPRKDKKQLYIDRSPVTYVSNIKAPVMIMAGRNDPRCPIQPIEEFVENLKELNHPHEFIIDESAGHASVLYVKEKSRKILTRMIEFFKETLK